jgi:glycine betaine transporter
VGIFIARISRGRTIREFVIGVLLAPTMLSMLWFAVFGGTGFAEEMHGEGGLAQAVSEDVTTALFTLFDRLPMAGLLAVVALVLIFIFIVTSVDSATFVLGMLTSEGAINPPTKRKLAWGISLGAMGAGLLLSGNIEAVKAVAVTGAVPFTLILLLQVAALLRTLPEDRLGVLAGPEDGDGPTPDNDVDQPAQDEEDEANDRGDDERKEGAS